MRRQMKRPSSRGDVSKIRRPSKHAIPRPCRLPDASTSCQRLRMAHKSRDQIIINIPLEEQQRR